LHVNFADDAEEDAQNFGAVLEAIGRKLDEGFTSGEELGCWWELKEDDA